MGVNKKILQVMASVMLFTLIVTSASTTVQAKKRGTSEEILLNQFGDSSDSDYDAFYAEMRFNHMIAQGIDTIYGNAYDMNIKKGGSYLLKFYTGSTFGKEYKNISYSSSNKSVATVSKNGKITAKKNGTTTITVKFLVGVYDEVGYTRKFKVCVTDTKIKGVPKTIDLSKSKTYSLSLSKGKAKSWKSSDTSVATIDKNGKLKGVGYGTTVISCKDSKGNTYAALVSASCGSAHKWKYVESLPAACYMSYGTQEEHMGINPFYFTPNCVFAKGFLTIEPTEDMTDACLFGSGNGRYWKPHHKIYTYVCKNCGLNKYDYDDEILSEDEGREILKSYANSELFGDGSYGADGCNGQAIFMSGLIFGDLPVTVHTDFTNLHVGDIIYYPTHFEVVYDVSADRKTFRVCGGGADYSERYWDHNSSGFFFSVEEKNPQTRAMFVLTRYGSEVDENYIVRDAYDFYGKHVDISKGMNVYVINNPASSALDFSSAGLKVRYYNEKGQIVYR